MSGFTRFPTKKMQGRPCWALVTPFCGLLRVAFAALAALSLRERAGAGADAAVAAGCADARRGRRWAGAATGSVGDGKLVRFSTAWWFQT